jgi:hypothetical protein
MPLRFKLGGRRILSAHLNVETAGSERNRYAFNTISMFWMLEGYLGITNDSAFLQRVVGDKTIAGLKKHASFAPFCRKDDDFTKTGSGQT